MLKIVLGIDGGDGVDHAAVAVLAAVAMIAAEAGDGVRVRTCLKSLHDQRAYTRSLALKLWSMRGMTLVKLKLAILSPQKKLFCQAGDPAESVFGSG